MRSGEGGLSVAFRRSGVSAVASLTPANAGRSEPLTAQPANEHANLPPERRFGLRQPVLPQRSAESSTPAPLDRIEQQLDQTVNRIGEVRMWSLRLH